MSETPKKCACVWETGRTNYGASFDLHLDTNEWTCGSCGGAIQPSEMPQEFRDDAELMTTSGVGAYVSKYKLPVHP